MEPKTHHPIQRMAVTALGGENGLRVGGLLLPGMCEGAVSEGAHVPM